MEQFSLGPIEKYKLACDLNTKAVSRITERGELLKFFLEHLNINRVSNKYKPMTIARVGQLLSHLDLDAIYFLKSTCVDAGNRGKNFHESFSKMFYWSIKVK